MILKELPGGHVDGINGKRECVCVGYGRKNSKEYYDESERIRFAKRIAKGDREGGSEIRYRMMKTKSYTTNPKMHNIIESRTI